MGEQSEIGTMNFIREGFSKLFIAILEHTRFNPSQPSQWQAVLPEEDKLLLSMPITEVEIKEGLWALKPYKALGLDGLHTGFFQRFWFIVGDSIRKEVKKIFDEKRILVLSTSIEPILF